MRRPILTFLLLLLGVAATACGKQEASVLERALEQEIRTATLDMRLRAAGFELTVRGPFEDNGPGRLPSFDWKLHGEGGGAGALDARVVSSGRNVFVDYGGRTYEVGEREIARFERQSRKGGGSPEIEDLEDVQRLGLRLQDWFPRSDVEEESRVGDEATTRVSGRLDVSAALKDLSGLAANPALAKDPALRPLAELGPKEIAGIDALVSDPRFAVDVAVSDGKLRRVEATMTVRKRPGGPGEKVRFVLTLSGVDRPVDIDAPAGGKPIGKLLERFAGGGDGAAPVSPS